jgi:uncharacterized protein (DUF488 family)
MIYMGSICLYTIGHSTRSLDEFLDILKTFGIGSVVDVRTIPKSRHNPHFNGEALKMSLEEQGIDYIQMKELGGLRRAAKESVNTAWRNASFRGFADYMQTPDFGRAIEGLLNIAIRRTTVIMCAEAVPWRCHRYLIADALILRKVDVKHILSPKNYRCHELTQSARVQEMRITYPG